MGTGGEAMLYHFGVVEEIKTFREHPPRIEIRISGNIECTLGLDKRRKTPYSHFIRGVLGGFASRLFNMEMFAEETRCIAMGEPYCEFIVKPKMRR